jgi:hypothetical protein
VAYNIRTALQAGLGLSAYQVPLVRRCWEGYWRESRRCTRDEADLLWWANWGRMGST